MDTDRPGERTADVLDRLGYALGPLDTAAELLGHATLFLELYDHPNEVHDLLEVVPRIRALSERMDDNMKTTRLRTVTGCGRGAPGGRRTTHQDEESQHADSSGVPEHVTPPIVVCAHERRRFHNAIVSSR
ncbi:MAG: hypothetical protein ACOCZB_08145 [Spirochaetota bacterium]